MLAATETEGACVGTSARPPVHLVFDLDGTLCDPAVGFVRCVNHALALAGLPARPAAELTPLIGPPLDEAFTTLLGPDPAVPMAELVAGYRQRYATVGVGEATLYDGVAEALAGLAAAGLRLGVCTSKRADFAEQILDRVDIRQHFGFVDGADVGIRKREQLAGLARAGRVDAGSVMVGDRAVDIEAARDNGLRAAGVLHGYGSAQELSTAGPDWLLAGPGELVAAFTAPGVWA